ncbi:MAG: hypothetical protein ACK53E_14345, partial [Pseudanabaena sp.]
MAITKSIKDIKYLSIYIESLNHLFFWFCGSAPPRGARPQNIWGFYISKLSFKIFYAKKKKNNLNFIVF